MNKLNKINDLIKYYDNHHFTAYIKGKNVIIVGPAAELKGQNRGKYIDEFDIVVRHNTVIDFLPFDQEYKNDYGSKTDILYLSPSCIKDNAKTSSINNIKLNDIKYITYQNGNKNNEYIAGDYCFKDELNYFKKNLEKSKCKMHYSHHSTALLTELLCEKSKKKIVPRTGFISIFDMIIHQAKSVEIIGMTFYAGGGHMFRKDVKNTLNPLLDHKGKKSPHDSLIEMLLMRDFLKQYDNIRLDYELPFNMSTDDMLEDDKADEQMVSNYKQKTTK